MARFKFLAKMLFFRFHLSVKQHLPSSLKLSHIQFSRMSTTASQPQPKITQWASKDGEFRRQVSSFRDSVSRDPNAHFAAEPYVLCTAELTLERTTSNFSHLVY